MAWHCVNERNAALTPAKALSGQTLAVRGPSGTHRPGTLRARGARRNEARALGRSWALGATRTQAALLLLAVTSGAPTEAANDALLNNEIADGRDILFWTQDDPAVFVSVSPLCSEWRVARPSVLYVMCKPDNACEVLVLRTLLGSGGTQRCARQPRSWRRDAARPRKRSNTIERRCTATQALEHD